MVLRLLNCSLRDESTMSMRRSKIQKRAERKSPSSDFLLNFLSGSRFDERSFSMSTIRTKHCEPIAILEFKDNMPDHKPARAFHGLNFRECKTVRLLKLQYNIHFVKI